MQKVKEDRKKKFVNGREERVYPLGGEQGHAKPFSGGARSVPKSGAEDTLNFS